MDQNPQKSSAVSPPEQINPNPARNGDLNDVEKGYPMAQNTQQGVPIFAGNPSQGTLAVPQVTFRCKGPCCIPLQTGCVFIASAGMGHALGGTYPIFRYLLDEGYSPEVYSPFLLVFGGYMGWSKDVSVVLAGLWTVLYLVVNVLLIVASKTNNSIFVILYVIATGILVISDVFMLFVVVDLMNTPVYYYILDGVFVLLFTYFLVVALFFLKEIKGIKTRRQEQVYMPQRQEETLGQNQVFGSPSQAYESSGQGQVVGSPGQGQVVGLPGQGQVVGSPGQGQVVGLPGQGQKYDQW